MAYGKLVLENEKGDRKKVPLGYSFMMLLVGPLLPLIRGQLGHVVLFMILLVPTLFLSWVIYPNFINFFWRRKLMKEGYRPVDIEGVSLDTLERKTTIDIENGIYGDNNVFPTTLGFIAANLFPITIAAALLYADSQRVNNLRGNDPIAYLEEIKGQSKYWSELKALDPERYEAEWAAETQRRREEAQRIEEEKRKARQKYSPQMDKFWDTLATLGAVYAYQPPAYNPQRYTQEDYSNLVMSSQFATRLEGYPAQRLFLISGVSGFSSDCERYNSSFTPLSSEQSATLVVKQGDAGKKYSDWLARNRSNFSLELRNMIATRTMMNGDRAGRKHSEMSGSCSEYNEAILWWYGDEFEE